MNHYLLSIVYPPDAVRPSEDELRSIMASVGALHEEMQTAGAWVFGGGLHDPTAATTVTIERDQVITTDGPFIESKEVLGGLTVIRAAHLDEALMWAEKTARATTVPVEVRPFVEGAGE